MESEVRCWQVQHVNVEVDESRGEAVLYSGGCIDDVSDSMRFEQREVMCHILTSEENAVDYRGHLEVRLEVDDVAVAAGPLDLLPPAIRNSRFLVRA